LGLNRVSGAALIGVRVLIGIALILFLLVLPVIIALV
jgi:hypothetical protein